MQYDKKIRPRLTLQALEEFYGAKIKPDIWKLEAMESKGDWKKIINLITGDREIVNTKVIVLGGGKNKQKVNFWLKTAAPFYEIMGFAVGRTIFFNPLVQFRNKKINKTEAVNKIARNFEQFINLWERSRK